MRSQKTSWFERAFIETIEELVIAVAIIVVIFTLVFRVVTVTGYSMVPNFDNGERILVIEAGNNYALGDVVIINNVLADSIIKRVIATGGQTVDFDTDRKSVVVDGVPIDDTAFGLEEGITTIPSNSMDTLDFPQVVPEGCVFVLGDNRTVSEDSRYKEVGMIDERNILGKAVLRIYPFSNIELIIN